MHIDASKPACRMCSVVKVALCLYALQTATAEEATDGSVGDESTLVEISFDQLSFDPGDEFRRMLVPAAVDELDGKRVRIKGYMWPSFKQRGISTFVLTEGYRNGHRYDADEVMRVFVQNGWGAEYTTRPVVVVGDFAVHPIRGEERYVVLYRIDNARVFSTAGERLLERLGGEAQASSASSPSQSN